MDPEGTTAQAEALAGVVAPRVVYAVFTQLAKYTVRFMNGTTVLQTVVVLSGGTAVYTGSEPVHPSNPEDMKFIGWEPSNENVTADTDCQPVWLDTSSKLRKILSGSISGTFSNSEATSVRPYAFYGCKNLDSVIFDNVRVIGSSAFGSINRNTTDYKSVSFPRVEIIHDCAFQGCRISNFIAFIRSLSNLQYIGAQNFGYYNYLGAIENSTVTFVGESCFYSCKFSGANFPKLEVIDKHAFANCSSMTYATLPEVKRIGDYAFSTCRKLESFYAPNLTYIGMQAFWNCSSLRSAQQEKVEYIGSSAFCYCEAISTASFPNASTIGSSAFAFCSLLEYVYLGRVSYFHSSVFYGCNNLKTMVLPSASGDLAATLAIKYPTISNMVIGGGYSTVVSAPTSANVSSLLNANSGVSIFVPESLVDAYKTSGNWSLLSDHIFSVSLY